MGYRPGAIGTATVTGAGSQWSISGDLSISDMDASSGVFNVLSGGVVSNRSAPWVPIPVPPARQRSPAPARSGSIVAPLPSGPAVRWRVSDGGTVTAGTLYASRSDLSGNGTVLAKGAVLDADIVFDGTSGQQSRTAIGDGGLLSVTLDGTGELGAGYKGAGTVRIAKGARAVSSSTGYLGMRSDAAGTATVTGAGTQWINSGYLYVGASGSGTLSIQAGAAGRQCARPTGFRFHRQQRRGDGCRHRLEMDEYQRPPNWRLRKRYTDDRGRRSGHDEQRFH